MPIDQSAMYIVMSTETQKMVAIVQQVTLEFFIWGVTDLLKNQSYMYNTDR